MSLVLIGSRCQDVVLLVALNFERVRVIYWEEWRAFGAMCVGLPGTTMRSLMLNFLSQIFSLNFHLSSDTTLHRHSTVEKRMDRRSTQVMPCEEEFCRVT